MANYNNVLLAATQDGNATPGLELDGFGVTAIGFNAVFEDGLLDLVALYELRFGIFGSLVLWDGINYDLAVRIKGIIDFIRFCYIYILISISFFAI